ncbi:MAG: DNA polymerase I [Candidatus Eremiobacteraeota bacterium]|nr:DNA polymerase I [Candidatus Eremiobacteraeota bacterium]
MDQIKKKKEKLILIDGNGLAYRAFYALPPLKTSRGEPMNAVYGFTTMLFQIIEEEKPDYIAVAFDKSRATWRLKQFDKYKAHRLKMPEELEIQFPFIEKIVTALKIPIFWKDGYEADDCIATLTNLASEKGIFTKIYSGDLDMLQLVSDDTLVVTTRRGISDLVIYDKVLVRKRYNINPPQLVDYKALAGDSSDHIPGIPGIGEASASKLLNQFEKIEMMYEYPEEVPSRWKKQILENREQAFLSKSLASLQKNLDLGVSWDELKLKEIDREDLKELFIHLEFKTMLKKMGFSDEELEAIQEITVMIVGRDEDLSLMLSKISSSGEYSILWKADENDLVGFAIGEGSTNGFYFPFILPENLNISSTFGISTFSADRVFHELKVSMENNSICKYVFNLKSGIKFLKRSEYFTGNNFVDLLIAAYLLEPENPPKTMETVLAHYSDFIPRTLEEIVSSKKSRKRIKLVEIPLQDLALFTAGRAVRLNKLGPDLIERLKEKDLYKIFTELEMPVVTVLSSMENRGVKIDLMALDEEAQKVDKKINEVTGKIYGIVGHEFNVNSSKQLGSVLFKELKLPGAKRTSTGYRTGAEILEKIIDVHPVVTQILRYRELAKLRSSYITTIQKQINPNTCKLHLKFHQNSTSTGRITTSSPNLSNVPDFIKRVFIPSDSERIFLGFEFSHLEHRILANLSGDEKLLSIFEKNGDVHAWTAAFLFEKDLEQVTPEMYNIAREVNFSFIHGMSSHALSQRLGIKRSSAREHIKRYFEIFQGVKKYIDDTIDKTREMGYIETVLGRKRYLPNINSKNKNQKDSAERTAISIAIEGSAADIIKKTMVGVFEDFIINHRDIHMILQIHNSFLFETKKRRTDRYSQEIKELMENVIEFSTPLVVKVLEGINWKEMNEKVQIKC